MTEKMVKVGIMSFAHMHAMGYAQCLQRLPNVEFVGIADDEKSRAKKVAADLGVKAFRNYEELLKSDVDAIIVTSENVNHRKHAVYAAQHEKHVMCEKPLAATREDADAIVEVCHRADVKLQTAFPCRYHPAFQRLKRAVDAGELGRIYGIKATNQGKCPGGWFIDKSLSGGGAVMDHTVHVLDLMRALTAAEPVRVYAEIDNRMLGGDVDDTGMISVDFSNGTFATIDSSWSRPKSYPFWGNVKLYVSGADGCADMDMFAQKIDHFSDIDSSAHYVYWGDDMDFRLVRSFVDSIASNTPVEVTGEDGAIATRVVAAAYESAETKEPVEL